MAQPGLIFTLDDRQVQKRVKSMLANLANLTPAMELIGETGVTSIQKNFEEGGRPDRWEDLAESTKAMRVKTGNWPGEILVQKGDMKRITYEAGAKEVVLMPADVPYAAIHHFGGKAGRNRSTDISARAYMLLQDEDGVEFEAILIDHVMEG